VVVSGPAEAKRWRDLGLAPDRMTTIPPGVNLPPLEPQAPLALPGMTEKSRIVMCVGPLEREKGFYGAIWVLDLLRFLYDNLHLVIVGVGPDRARLEEFAHSIRVNDRVHFIGAIADAPALLQSAELVWVPSETAGGEQVALEAMAAGRPIVASAVASLEELIVDGETGYLVAPEDRITFGKNARRLLDHADARQGVGAAGREHVARHFTVSAMADQFGELYGRLAAGRGN
jgi:glycosyltransferase involved in cell wall biosynthesis